MSVTPYLSMAFRLPGKFLFNDVNSLENIVNSKAVFSTLASRSNIESINENLFFQQLLTIGDFRLSFDLLYFITIAIFLYIRYSIDISKVDTKLANIESYSNTRRLTNIVLLILLIIFTKNVENAI